MRPRRCWIVLLASTLAALLLASDDEDSTCSPGIMVKRGTTVTGSVGQELRISCKVDFCDEAPTEVSWVKIYNGSTPINPSRTEWEKESENKGISHLAFPKLLKSDSGRYACSIHHPQLVVGHHIDVIVTGDGELTNGAQANGTMNLGSTSGETWMYVYSAAGIVAVVVVVIGVSVAMMRGCKGKSRTQTENQQPLHRPSPRGSPAPPPSRRSTKRKMPSRQSGDVSEGETTGNAGRQRDRAEEEEEREGDAGLVYVALNHQLPARGGARPQRPAEETSEYAAIRVA